jgi:hypothetical protein
MQDADGDTQIQVEESSDEDKIRFDTGGTERMIIDSSGNVGIGETSIGSQNKLHIKYSDSGATAFTSSPLVIERSDVNLINILSADGTDQGILFGDATDNDIGGLFYLHGSNAMTFRTNTAERMRIDSSGNVGIGTTSVGTKLNIRSDASDDGILLEKSDGTDIARLFYDGTSTNARFDMFSGGSATVQIKASGDTHFSGGNVGIGTDSPTNLLHLKGTSATPVLIQSNENPIIAERYAANADGPVIFLRSSRNATVGSHTVQQSGDEIGAIRVLGSDGTDFAPSSNIRFEVDGTPGDNDMPGRIVFETAPDGTQSPAERMRIDSSGNLLVGKTASGQILTNGFEVDSSNDGYISFCGDSAANYNLYLANKAGSGTRNLAGFYNASTLVGSITHNGSNTAFNTSSDARLKDITGEARGLEVINELNPVSYNWKADGQADEGLIAQEVQEIVPNAVTGSEEEMYQMDYSKLVVHLVAGMKEQQTQIEALQSEINELKNS